MGIVLRQVPQSIEEIGAIARRLTHTPVFDEFGRRLRIIIERITPTRSVEQNALMWALIGDIHKQVQWMVDGEMVWLEPEEWKEVLTAGVKKAQRVAAGIEGGFVILGSRTSRMSKVEMTALIDFIQYFGTTRNVVWSRETAGQLPPIDGESRRIPDPADAPPRAALPQQNPTGASA